MLEPTDTPNEVFHRAQVAVLAAKNDGKGMVATYDQRLAENLRERHDIVQDLDRAIAERSIEVAFQPIVDIKTGYVHSLESLARWTTREGRPVSPSVFVRVAEQHGLIEPLFDHMLEASLTEAAPWFDAHPDLCIHVNLSPLQMRERGLAERVTRALERASVAPKNIGLEVTESVLALDQSITTENLDALTRAGLKIVLDDFGTGYSSLSYLMRFEPEMLKLDRSFVEQMASRNDPRLARSILSLATEFDIVGVAEGVETMQQLEMLQAVGWPLGQGFLWSGGLSANEITPLLENPLKPLAA
jgi:EAL domain-containing protein (putative c-di-GMP-specific phosphodiesterase class I)